MAAEQKLSTPQINIWGNYIFCGTCAATKVENVFLLYYVEI